MKRDRITNMHVDNISDDDARCAVGCTIGGEDFHMWLRRNSGGSWNGWTIEKNVLYVNTRETRGRPDHRTRKRDVTAASNKELVTCMMAAAPRLIREAIEKRNAEAHEQELHDAAMAREQRVKDNGIALLDALKPLVGGALWHADRLNRQIKTLPPGNVRDVVTAAATLWEKLARVGNDAIETATGERVSEIAFLDGEAEAEEEEEAIDPGQREIDPNTRVPGGTLTRVDLVRGDEVGEVRAQWYSDQPNGIRVGAFLPGTYTCIPGDTPKQEPEVSCWVSADAVDRTMATYVESAKAAGWIEQ